MLTVRAFTADRAIARRETTEKKFIATLEDEGYDEWEGRTNSCRVTAAQYLLL